MKLFRSLHSNRCYSGNQFRRSLNYRNSDSRSDIAPAMNLHQAALYLLDKGINSTAPSKIVARTLKVYFRLLNAVVILKINNFSCLCLCLFISVYLQWF